MTTQPQPNDDGTLRELTQPEALIPEILDDDAFDDAFDHADEDDVDYGEFSSANDERLLALSAEELVAEMADFGLDLPLERWRELVAASLSSHEVLETAMATFPDIEEWDEDFELFELASYLWPKLSPGVRDLEHFVYEFRNLEYIESLDETWEAWNELANELFEFMRVKGVRSVEELDAVFFNDVSFSNDLLYTLEQLTEADEDVEKWAGLALETAERLLEKGCFETLRFQNRVRITVGNALFAMGDASRGNAYFEQCLADCHTDGNLWGAWATELVNLGNDGPHRARALLERAIALPDLEYKTSVLFGQQMVYTTLGLTDLEEQLDDQVIEVAAQPNASDQRDVIRDRVAATHPHRVHADTYLALDDSWGDEDDFDEDDFDEVEVDEEELGGKDWAQSAYGGRLELDEHEALLNSDRADDEDSAGTFRNAPGAKVGRNDPCPCNSGKKYKKCCGR